MKVYPHFIAIVLLIGCILAFILSWAVLPAERGANPAAYLIFTSNLNGTALDLYQIDSLGRRFKRLTDVLTVMQSRSVYDATCSPTGSGDVLFTVVGSTWRVAVDGRNLSPAQSAESLYFLTWSSDGSQIAGYRPLLAPDYETVNLMTFLPDGSALIALGEGGYGITDLAWSPDGEHLIISRFDPAGNWSTLHSFAVDSGQMTLLTEMRGNLIDFTWSPTSEEIVFMLLREDYPNIYRMRSDGTEMVQLTSNSRANIYPRWSPDGQMISFSSNREERGFQIYLMNADGTDQRRITGREFDYRDNFNRCWLIRPAVLPTLLPTFTR